MEVKWRTDRIPSSLHCDVLPGLETFSKMETCKQQKVGFPISSPLTDLKGNWTGVVDAHYLEEN